MRIESLESVENVDRAKNLNLGYNAEVQYQRGEPAQQEYGEIVGVRILAARVIRPQKIHLE